MQVKNFEDLEIWKDARLLTKAVYQITKDVRFAKDFALRDQIRRAAVSIMSNIAEGFERGGNQEFHPISLCCQSIVRRSSLSALRSPGSILCSAERL